jgi:type III secretion protein Q
MKVHAIREMQFAGGWLPASAQFERIDTGLLRSLNAIAAPRAPLRFSVRGANLSVRLCAGRDAPTAVSLPVRIGAHRARLGLGSGLIASLLGGADPAPWRRARASVLRLLAQALLHEWRDAGSALLGMPLQLDDDDEPLPPACAWLAMDIRVGDSAVAHRAVLAMDPACCAGLAALLATVPVRAGVALDGVRLPLSIVAGWQTLDPLQLARLAPGDAVMLETAGDGWSVLLQNQRIAVVDPAPGGLRCRRRIDPQNPEGDAMTNTLTQAATGESGLDRLPVQLTCEVARLDMPLGDLRALAPGHILPLATLPGEEIDLRINGQRVGKGELVRLGDSLAVRIVSWPSHE